MSAISNNGRESGDSTKPQRDQMSRRQRRKLQRQQEKEKLNLKSQGSPRPSLSFGQFFSNSSRNRSVNVEPKKESISKQSPANEKFSQIDAINLTTPQEAPKKRPISLPLERNPNRLPLKAKRPVSKTPRPSNQAAPIPINRREMAASNPTEPKVKPPQPKLTPVSPLVYSVRLLILGVGIGAIAGTVLSAWDPTKHSVKGKAANTVHQLNKHVSNSVNHLEPSPPKPLPLGQEITLLKEPIQELVKRNPKLQPGVFLFDLDNNTYFDWESNSTFSAASTIKVPILVAFFQDVDAGKIRLDEQLTIQKEMIGGGSGDLQYRPVGTKLTALDVATKMIVISDNTATNMLITRLGGAEALNQRFQSWGLTTTVIRNPLPDLEGTNTTTPKELGNLMGMITQGDLVSPKSRDRILDIMQRTVTNTLLPRGLDKDATIAHKTGDIGSLVADVGLIDMPTGKRYIAVVMVKRPHNNPGGQELIRQISKISYKFFNEPVTTPSANPTPISSPTPPTN